MRCETCQGEGKVGPLPIPCGDCGGTGFAHCCEGDRVKHCHRACPEPEADKPEDGA